MVDGSFIKYLSGRRAITIYSSKSTAVLAKLLQSEVTKNAPHGIFRDWPNTKPFMGTVDASGFDLLEKTMFFGQGWPAKLEGSFHQEKDQSIVSVFVRPTKGEQYLLWSMNLIAPVFILLAIFAQGTPSEPMTLVNRAVALGIVIFMLAASWRDTKERTKRVTQKLTDIFDSPTERVAG